MTRINTNVSSLIGQRVLNANNNVLSMSLERLSTGLRINRGKDDPAGLIASENLRAEIRGLDQAIKNAERADQVVNIAEGGLNEISALLTELQSLVVQTANTGGLSREELEANQLQIDSILQTIDRVSSATSFQGLKLLNGNMDYQSTSISGVVNSFKVNGAKLGFGETRDVQVLVTGSAQVGALFLSLGATSLDLGAADDTFVIEIQGANGARELSFSSGATTTDIAAAINTFTSVTGVQATAVASGGATGLRLESDEYGSDEFVKIRVLDDGAIGNASAIGIYDYLAGNANGVDASGHTDFVDAENGVTDNGQDVTATINGIVATTKGTRASINTDFLDVDINLAYDLTSASAATLGAVNAFSIEGGGADFQLASQVNIGGKVSLGIGNVAVRELGRVIEGSGATQVDYLLKDLANGRTLNVVDGDRETAQQVVSEAIREVSSLRGRLGAFQKNVIGATIRSLGVSLENTTAAESSIRDTDFAEQSAELTRSQILVQSATQVLGIANTQPQAALSLLG
jgi:flagellin